MTKLYKNKLLSIGVVLLLPLLLCAQLPIQQFWILNNTCSDLLIKAGNTYTVGSKGVLAHNLTGTGTVNVNGNTLQVGCGNATGNFAGTVSGTGSFIKISTGKITLSGANTFTGTTTINNGELSITGTQASTSYTLNNTGMISSGQTNQTFNSMVFNNNSGINYWSLGGTGGTITTPNITTGTAANITVNIMDALPDCNNTYVVLTGTATSGTLGSNLSGCSKTAVLNLGASIVINSGWGSFLPIYWSARANIFYQVPVLLTGTTTFALAAGNLPTGLTINAAGLITGSVTVNPATDQTFNFTLTQTNGTTTLTQAFSWVVKAPLITRVTTSQYWYIPYAYCTNITPYVMAVGGGGGANTSAYGDGGGGGQVVAQTATIPSTPVYFTIGAGGNAGNNGSATTIGTYLTATGGCAGQSRGSSHYSNYNGGKNNGQCGKNGTNQGQNGVFSTDPTIYATAITAFATQMNTDYGTNNAGNYGLGAGGGGGSYFSPGSNGIYGGGKCNGGNGGGTSGTANTGGGGGGGGGYGGGAGGGSGVVYLKY